jgi:hypothetical protein
MVSRVSSSAEEEDLAPALRSSQLSSDTSDEQVAQTHPEGPTSAEQAPRPTTPRSNGKGNLPLGLDVSQRTPEEQVSRLESYGPAPASNDARPATPPNECHNDDLDQVPRLPDDNAHEHLNQRKGARTVVGGIAITLSEAQVRVMHMPRLIVDEYARTTPEEPWRAR